MIIYHSKLDLKRWCINRDYLRYQEGIISKTDFMKTVEENKDHEKRTYWRDRWKTWRNERFGGSNQGVFFDGAGAGPNAGGGIEEVNPINTIHPSERQQDRMDRIAQGL